MAKTFLVFCFVASASVYVLGEQALTNTPARAQFGALRPSNSNDPFRALFAPVKPAEPPAQAEIKSKTTVRCGLTIVEVTPAIDPKMVVSRPSDTANYSMRIAPPSICGAPR